MSTVEPLTERKKPMSALLTFDRLCRLLGVRTTELWCDDWDRMVCGHAWDPDLTEEENWKAEEEERDEAYAKYEGTVVETAREVFTKHGLSLVEVRKGRGKRRYTAGYEVYPVISWRDAADKIRETINGVGHFRFETLRELLVSGPYTPREAVLSHLGWVPDWYAVYEGGTAASRVERRLR